MIKCCWNEEKKEFYGTESISTTQCICLGCHQKLDLEVEEEDD